MNTVSVSLTIKHCILRAFGSKEIIEDAYSKSRTEERGPKLSFVSWPVTVIRGSDVLADLPDDDDGGGGAAGAGMVMILGDYADGR